MGWRAELSKHVTQLTGYVECAAVSYRSRAGIARTEPSITAAPVICVRGGTVRAMRSINADADGDDAVAGQLSALFDRGRPCDFVAVYQVLRAGRYSRERLIELLRARDAGYDPIFFAGVLAELPHIPDEDFAPYGLDELETAIMRARFADWYRALVSRGIP
jgi:hypothetical protein